MSPEEKVSEKLQLIMDALSQQINGIAGQPLGISLLVFNATPGGRMSYASNCDREEVINAMKSLIAGWEAGMPDIPAHEFDS